MQPGFCGGRPRHRLGFRWGIAVVLCILIVLVIPSFMKADERAASASTQSRCLGKELSDQAAKAIDHGIAFLVASQRPDGGWAASGSSDPAVTALVAKCFAQHSHYGPEHDITKRAFDFICRYVQEDGGIYVRERRLRNYDTSTAVMALSLSEDPKYREIRDRACKFLIKRQWDEGEGYKPAHTFYGGAGYGRHKRPDLSNTQMMLEALSQCGLPQDHEVFRKAMIFVSRCQLLDKTNSMSFAQGGDGGFIYSPANGGESQAGTIDSGVIPDLRSYGSMTYAGLKCMLYAGVEEDDPRVVAARRWISDHYTLDGNPNMPADRSLEGLYYYYHVFARTLRAMGQDRIVDSDGVSHCWREDLCRKLLETQLGDGSWVNEADRWYESNPYLVTSYSVLSLQAMLERVRSPILSVLPKLL